MNSSRDEILRARVSPCQGDSGAEVPAAGAAVRLNPVFESLSDRLTGALSGLRGKGRLTDADIDATAREIRLALLEADVSLPVTR